MDLFDPSTKTFDSAGASSSASPNSKTIYKGGNHFISRLSKRRVLPFALAAVVIVLAGAIYTAYTTNKRIQSVNRESEEAAALLDVPDTAFGDLPQVLADSFQNASRVSINGPLEINSDFTITPSDRPVEAKAGQIYFDADSRNFVFFDGGSYQTISTAQNLGVVRGLVESQQAQNEALIEERVNAGIGIVFAQLQDTLDVSFVELEGQDGIEVEENRIFNTGVTRLQGTANQVLLSANTGQITVSLPQDIHSGATPTFAGANLSALDVSGTATVNALAVSNLATINFLTLQQALGINSGGTGTDGGDFGVNGLFYYTGTQFATVNAAEANMCLVSAVGAPKFAHCGDMIADSAVTRLNGLTGALTITNADASGTTITLHDAAQTRPGLVNTVSQRFNGLKTFVGGIELGLSANLSAQGNMNILQANFGNLVLGNSTGNVVLPGVDCSAAGNGGKLTLDGDGVILCANDTGGDGVGLASISASDATITVDNTDGDNPKIAVNTRSGGGLDVNPGGLGLLASCTDGQTLKYSSGSSSWGCADDNDSQPTQECPTCVALQEETPGVAQDGHINITGTVISGGGQINGPLLLKNLTDTVEAFDLQNVTGDSLVRGNTENMVVTIGSLTSPSTSILSDDLPTGPTRYLSTGSFLVTDVAVSGDYAYIITDSSYLYVADVSDPDNDPEQVFAGSMGGNLTNPKKALVIGDYLYVLDAVNTSYSSVRVFDVSDPSSPSFVLSRNDTGRTAVDMVHHGSYLYTVNHNSSSFSNSTVYAYDVSDPADPALISTHEIPGQTVWPTALAARGTTLFVTDRGLNQLHALNISDPEEIAAISSVSTSSGPVDVSIRGSRAYVLNQSAVTLQTFDISDPADMSLLDSSEPGEIHPSPSALHASAGYIYLVTYYNGGNNAHGYFQMFNTSDPDHPSLVGSVPLIRRAVSITVQDGIAYVGEVYPGQSNMQVLRVGNDVTTLQIYGNSHMTGSLDLDGNLSARNATFSGNVLASNLTALNTVQTQELDSAVMGGTIDIGSTYANAINLNQNTTLAAGKSLTVGGSTSITTDSAAALQVKDSADNNLLLVDASGMNVEIGSQNAPTENTDVGGSIPDDGATGSINISSLPNAVAVSGDYAYVASSIMRKLQIVNVSQPGSPALAGHVATAGDARAVHVSGDRAYLAVHPNTVEIYDVSNPDSPSLLGSFTTQNAASSIQALTTKDNHVLVAYVGSAAPNYGFVDAVDVTNPAATTHRSTKTLVANAKEIRMALKGDRLYLVYEGNPTTYSGMRILNVSNPAAASLPHTNHNLSGLSPSGGIAVHGDYAFVPFNNDSTLKIYDISTISGSGTLTPAGDVPINSGPSDIAISESGKYAYITSETSNDLQVLNIADPIVPQSLGVVDVSSGSGTAKTVAVAAANGGAYVVNNTRSNLVIVDLAGSAPRIALNQNTILHAGRTLTAQGDTLVKTDSSTALRVQNTAGQDVLVVDTEDGTVIATSAFAVGDDTGISASCGEGESLNNIVVTGGIITGGTCGDGTGEGGGDGGDGGDGPELEFGPDGGLLIPSIDALEAGQTLSIGPANADLINLNQDTEIAAGKSLTVQGDTAVSATSEAALSVSDADSTQYLLVDTANGHVVVGAPVPDAGEEEGGAPMPEAPAGSAGLSGQPFDVIIKGDYAFVTLNFDDTLAVYNISDGANPASVTTLSLSDPEHMAIDGDRLYITANNVVHVVDISDPTSPALLSTTSPFSGYTGFTAIGVTNNRIYVSTSDNKLLAYNAANSPPTVTGGGSSKFHFNSAAWSLAGKDGYIYGVDNGFGHVKVFTADGQVNQAGFLSGFTKPTSLAIHGNYAYVVSSPNNNAAGTLEVVDLSSPTAPAKVSGSEVATENWPIDVAVSADGSFAAVINYNSTSLQIFDLASPTAPTLRGSVSVGTGPLATAANDTQIAVVGTADDYLEVYTAVEPAEEPGPPPDPEFGVSLNSNVIVEEGNTMHIHGDTTVRTDSATAFRIQNASKATLLNVDTESGNIDVGLKVEAGTSDPVFETPAEATALSTTSTAPDRPSAIARKDNYVYLAMRDTQGNKILTYDVSDPEDPQETGSVSVNDPIKVAVQGNYLYAISPSNVYVLSLADPAEPALTATLNSPGSLSNLKDFSVTDTHLYIYDGGAYKIATINITDPANPSYQSQQPGSSMWTNLYSVAVYGSYAYTIDNFLFHKMFIFNLADPDNPAAAGELALTSGVRAMAVHDHYLYIHNGSAQVLDVYDLTDPANPVKLPDASLSLTGIGTAQSMVVSEDGGFAAIVDSGSGGAVHIIDLTNAAAPAYLGAVASAAPTAVTTDANNIYVVSNSNQTMLAYKVSTTPEPPEPPKVTFNNNTVIAQGQTLTVQGNTTVKTDSATAFSVQTADGSTIFTIDTVNGAVLVSGDLEVDNLTVTGATTLASLTVSADATFLANITVNGHIVTGGEAPVATVLTAAGTDAGCTVEGNDISGTITVTIGTADNASGDLCQLTFSASFEAAPRPIISGADADSAALGGYAAADTTTLTIGTTETPVAEAEYQFNYWNPQ